MATQTAASTAPQLEGAALDAVRHRGGHVQIIAAAGSGKTEVVSQRVADLLAEATAPEAIVAFTFTERAAEELGNRIARRVEERLGRAALDRLGGLFVGTIHSYCFRLLHLIVDEYQDVNPAQERLIRLLVGPETELCVVGDDHQAIYQWRGSDVSNIIDFAHRYPAVATFEITTNRRSRPGIIEVANTFSATIPGSIDKTMLAARAPAGNGPEVVLWRAPSEADEAGWIAGMVDQLAQAGTPYRDIAVLVRTPGSWRPSPPSASPSSLGAAPACSTNPRPSSSAGLSPGSPTWSGAMPTGPRRDQRRRPAGRVRAGLRDPGAQETAVAVPKRVEAVRPQREAHRQPGGRVLRAACRTGHPLNRLHRPGRVNRLGTLARFSSLLVDYESVRRRTRPDPDTPGEQVGGQDRGTWYYRNLGIHIINFAQGAYKGFDGEAGYALDAVDLTTVHRAKGLEWPVVFAT